MHGRFAPNSSQRLTTSEEQQEADSMQHKYHQTVGLLYDTFTTYEGFWNSRGMGGNLNLTETFRVLETHQPLFSGHVNISKVFSKRTIV